MDTLNRSAIVVKPKQPFLDWLHTADPTSHGITLQDVSREPRIYRERFANHRLSRRRNYVEACHSSLMTDLPLVG